MKAKLLFIIFIQSLLSIAQSKDSALIKAPSGMTVAQFKAQTNVRNKLVLVNFAADWCVVCKKEKPVLDQVRAENKDNLIVLIIDMEKNPLIAEYFEVDGLPMNLLYKNGTLVWDRMGLLPKEEFYAALKLNK